MSIEESIVQLKSLIEHFGNGGNDFNATDVVAIKNLLEENKQLKAELKNKPDTEITLQDDKGNNFAIIQTERIDMQKQLNKTIERLFDNWNKLKEQCINRFNKSQDIQFLDVLQDMQKLELEQGSD